MTKTSVKNALNETLILIEAQECLDKRQKADIRRRLLQELQAVIDTVYDRLK